MVESIKYILRHIHVVDSFISFHLAKSDHIKQVTMYHHSNWPSGLVFIQQVSVMLRLHYKAFFLQPSSIRPILRP